MAQFDLPLDQLRIYIAESDEQPDCDDFSASTLTAARSHQSSAHYDQFDAGLPEVTTCDVRFAGYGGTPIAGWLVLPRHRTGSMPCIVEFMGYGAGRATVYSHLRYAAAGYAHFVMDSRGQGGGLAIAAAALRPRCSLSG